MAEPCIVTYLKGINDPRISEYEKMFSEAKDPIALDKELRRDFILNEHKKLSDALEKIKKEAGVKNITPYQKPLPPDEKQISKIKDEYQPQIDAALTSFNNKVDRIPAQETKIGTGTIKSEDHLQLELDDFIKNKSSDKLTSGTITIDGKENSVDQYVNKAKAVLDHLFPDHTLVIHQSEADYVAKENRPIGSAGVFHPDTKTIALNLERIQKAGAQNTVFHEVIHPILEGRPKVVNEAYTHLVELKDMPGMENIWKHEELYRDRGLETMKKEAVTEFLTQVADGKIDISKLNTNFSTKIIDVINKIFKVLGIDKVISTATDLKRLSESIKEGFDKADAAPIEKVLGNKTENKTSGSSLDALKNTKDEEKLRGIIDRTDKSISDEKLKELIVKATGLPEADIKALIDEVRNNRPPETNGSKQSTPPGEPPPDNNNQQGTEAIPPQKGVGISKQAIKDQYSVEFQKTKVGWSEMAENALDRMNEDAAAKNTTIEQEAAFQVLNMAEEIRNDKLSASPHRIIAATTNLINVEQHLDGLQNQKANTPQERAWLATQIEIAENNRDLTLQVLNDLGSLSGKNLGLFAGIFSKIDDGGLTIARRKMEGVLGTEIPTSEAELNANEKLSDWQKNRIRPYVKKIEEIKKDYDKKIAEINNRKASEKQVVTDKVTKERKKTSQSIRDFAAKVRKSESLDKIGLGKPKGGPDVQTQGFTVDVKELLANALDFIADGVEAGEDLVQVIANASAKFRGSNDDKEFRSLLRESLSKKDVPKTNAEKLDAAKELVTKRIKNIRDQIANQERNLKAEKKPLNEDQELTRMKEEEKSLKNLLDNYLPEQPGPHSEAKRRERIKDKLNNDISTLNDQINAKQRSVREAKNTFKDDAELKSLRATRAAKEDILDEVDPESKQKRILKSQMDAAQRQIDEYQRKIKFGILPGKKLEIKQTPELKKLLVERDAARKAYQQFVDTGVAPRENVPVINVSQDVRDEEIMWQKKVTQGKLNQLTRQVEDSNRKWYSKALDWRRAALIGGIKTVARVSVSGGGKFLIDPIVKRIGSLTSFLPGLKGERVSLQSAGEGLISIGRFKDDKTALEYVNKKRNEFEIAANNLEKSNEVLKQLGIDHGEQSSQYQKYQHEDNALALKNYKSAELENGQAAIYKWIHGNGFKDIKDLIKYGSTDFEQAMGGYGKIDYSILTKSEKALYYFEAMNRSHAVLKNSSARRALVETYNSKLENYQKQGIPITASTRMRALDMAYGEFLAGKYQERTQLVDLVNSAKSAGEKPNASTLQKIWSGFLRIGLPVAKVGINITKGGIDMSSVGVEGLVRYIHEAHKGMKLNAEQGKQFNNVFEQFAAGAENIPEKEKLYISKVLNRGLFGIGLMAATGYMVSNGLIQYGGEYDSDHKAKRKYKGKDGYWHTLDYGEWVINDVHMGKLGSSILNHLPEFLPVAMVVNSHDVWQYEREYTGVSGRRKIHGPEETFGDVIKSDVNEITERLPFKNLLEPIQMAKSLLSLQISKDISEYFDKDKDGNLIERKPKGIIQNVESNIGLRALTDKIK